MLEIELAERERQLNMAQRALDTAIAHAIATDPLKDQLVFEFFRVGKHLLRLAQVAKTLGIQLSGVSCDEAGIGLRLTDPIQPGSEGHSAFKPDPAFKAAVADLRVDPDTPFPDLPTCEPRE